MEKELGAIKGTLIALAIVIGCQAVFQTCVIVAVNEQVERVANRMPSDANPRTWANEFGSLSQVAQSVRGLSKDFETLNGHLYDLKYAIKRIGRCGGTR